MAKKLTSSQKAEAISRVQKGQQICNVTVAKSFAIPESTLRSWCKNGYNPQEQVSDEAKNSAIESVSSGYWERNSSSLTPIPNSRIDYSFMAKGIK